jgi:hypothetical protein
MASVKERALSVIAVIAIAGGIAFTACESEMSTSGGNPNPVTFMGGPSGPTDAGPGGRFDGGRVTDASRDGSMNPGDGSMGRLDGGEPQDGSDLDAFSFDF